MGAPDELVEFCGARAPGLLCLSDPGQQAYRAYGLERAGMRELIGPPVLAAGFQAMREGFRMGPVVGDARQMPGTFVIDTAGRVRLAYYSRTVADHATDAQLLAALAELNSRAVV